MALASGLGSQMGMARETVYGTAVTPTRFFEFDTEGLALEQTYIDGVGLRAGRTFAPQSRTKRTTRMAGGAIALDVPTKTFGSILDLTHGLTVAPVQQAATTAYSQTHPVGTSQPNKSSTLQFNKPTSQGVDVPFTYPGAVLESIAFSLDVGGTLKCTTTWMVQDERTPTTSPAGPVLATATYATGVTVWDHTEVSLTLGGTAAAAISSASWTWTQPYKDNRFFLGSGGLRAKPIPNDFATVTGTFGGEWFDSTYYDLFRSGAFAELVVTAQGAVIEGAYNSLFRNTFSAIQIRGESPTVGGPDVLETSLPFVAKDNGVAAPWVAEYISTDAAI